MSSERPTVLVLVWNQVSRDARVLRHIEALKGDYAVVTVGYGPEPEGLDAHIQINPASASKAHKVFQHALLASRVFQRYYWSQPEVRQVLDAGKELRFDAVLANDIETVPVALEIAQGRPVFADLHEYAPRWRDNNRRWMLITAPYMDYLCRKYLSGTAMRATVADSLAREYEREYGLAFATLTNAARFRSPQPRPTGTPIKLVHTGSAAANRQLEVMIEGASGLPDVTLDMFLVPGSDADYNEGLRRLADQTPNVRVLPPVPVSDLPELHDRYDVGLSVLSTQTFNTRYSLPNKLFDYVQSGLGIIVGPSPEMAAVVERYGLGAVLDEFSGSCLAERLESLTPSVVDGWKAATCAAAQPLSGEIQAESLRAMFKQMLGG